MPYAIDQFIWGFQPHFRHGIEHEVRESLRSIGIDVRPWVLLVGVAVDDGRAHPICVEPEKGPFTSAELVGLEQRATEIYSADPESEVIISYRRLHDLRQASLFRKARATSIKERLEANATFQGLVFFVSNSAPINGYEVHTCIGLPAATMSDAPAVPGPDLFERIYVAPSLPVAVLDEILGAADSALYKPDPGSSLGAIERSRFDIVREAAIRFAEGCVVRSGELPGGGLFVRLNEITATTYEGASAAGHLLVVGSDGAEAVDVEVQLRKPVHLSRTRQVRKLLEMSRPGFRLLVTGTSVVGLGKPRVDARAEQLSATFEVDVVGHATWDLSHNSRPLLRVAYGMPSLPRPLIDLELFSDTARRVFEGIEEAEVEHLQALVIAAADASHGTTLAISVEAEKEAERLKGESTRVEPTPLTPAAVARLSAIDGAILIDPQGTCHAIGLILDGTAAGTGDPARGARFNSALRYLQSAETPVLLVVVSEDGGVDLVPTLRPRVRRAQVQAAIETFREAVRAEDGDLYSRARDDIDELAFYMDQAQCDAVNALEREEWDRRAAEGGIRLLGRDIAPNGEMDDRFFISD